MIWKLQKVVELEMEMGNGEKLELRLEVFSMANTVSKDKFKVRVFRYETFNCEPAFEADPEFQKAIHIWAILDPRDEAIPFSITNIDEATNWYLRFLFEKLGLPIDTIS
jgi:hypothetical protein